jgi:hypothetical protein
MIGGICQARMPRVLKCGNYGVFVLDERGQRHHRPHAHIKHRGHRVASIFLLTLRVFDETERLPSDLVDHIREHQEELLAAWEKLNGE